MFSAETCSNHYSHVCNLSDPTKTLICVRAHILNTRRPPMAHARGGMREAPSNPSSDSTDQITDHFAALFDSVYEQVCDIVPAAIYSHVFS